MGMTRPNIVEFTRDPGFLGLSPSVPQEVVLRSVYGLPLETSEQRDAWEVLAGGRPYRVGQVPADVTLIGGARGGKDSHVCAPIACYEACFGGHEQHLGRGETGVVVVVAQDQRAGDIAFDYIRGGLEGSPVLASRIATRVFPPTRTSMRGWTIACGILSEIGFWALEGQANADVEVLASIRRGTIAVPGAKIIKASAPWLQAGVLWDDFERAFAKSDPDLLVLVGPSAFLNPVTITGEKLAQAQRRDPERYAREYLAVFSDASAAFLPGQAVSDAVAHGRFELAARPGVSYAAGADVSGGAARENADAFTFSICHPEGSGSDLKVVQDVIRGWRATRTVSLDLDGVVGEIATLCRSYGISTVWGDKYGSGWVVQAMERAGITYRSPEMDRSRIYIEAGPYFTQGRATILDHEPSIRELRALQRKLKSGGKEVVDHPQSGHDDHANSLCLAIVQAASASSLTFEGLEIGSVARTTPRATYGPSSVPPMVAEPMQPEAVVLPNGVEVGGEDEDGESGFGGADGLCFSAKRRNRYGY